MRLPDSYIIQWLVAIENVGTSLCRLSFRPYWTETSWQMIQVNDAV
jgi:hypothetical protein